MIVWGQFYDSSNKIASMLGIHWVNYCFSFISFSFFHEMVNYLIAFIDSKLIIARNSWMLASLIIIIIIIFNIVVLHKYAWRNFFGGQMTIYEYHARDSHSTNTKFLWDVRDKGWNSSFQDEVSHVHKQIRLE